MIADSGAGSMPGIFKNIFAKIVSEYFQKCGFRTRKKGLPDTASNIKVVIISNVFLIIGPNFLFAFSFHFTNGCDSRYSGYRCFRNIDYRFRQMMDRGSFHEPFEQNVFR